MNKNALWRQVLRNLITIDYTGGWLAGVVILALSGWLSWLYVLPFWFVMISAVANLVYGTFSFSISRQVRRPVTLIATLAFANIAWGTAKVMSATRKAAARTHTHLAELRTLHDLDTPADLARLKTSPQFAALLDGLRD